MTISPPPKVKTRTQKGVQVLTVGVDSLNLALDIQWKDEKTFKILEEAKACAAKDQKPSPVFIYDPERERHIPFSVLPHGTNGYCWILTSREYALRIGDWIDPKQRPSAMVEIRSETLWHRGLVDSVTSILSGLEACEAKVLKTKPSRMDLCMDLLLPETMWKPSLVEKAFTRATQYSTYMQHRKFSGMSIGKGKLSARLYDKALEIQSQSKKTWMYDIWQLEEVPEGKKVIRVEFQLRREALKALGLDCIEDAFKSLENVWAYCTQKWLKFQTSGKHHTQRRTLPWWKKVQQNYLGVHDPVPSIRAKAIRNDQKQLSAQLVGLATSLAATLDEEDGKLYPDSLCSVDLESVFHEAISISGKTPPELLESITEKKSNYYRDKLKYRILNSERFKFGLPADSDALGIPPEKQSILDFEAEGE